MDRKRTTQRAWQIRLPNEEDETAQRIADARKVSKNDVVRHAIRLLSRLDREEAAGARLLIERIGRSGVPEPVELWIVW